MINPVPGKVMSLPDEYHVDTQALLGIYYCQTIAHTLMSHPGV
jgi:hypothetical protein